MGPSSFLFARAREPGHNAAFTTRRRAAWRSGCAHAGVGAGCGEGGGLGEGQERRTRIGEERKKGEDQGV